ncbi:hypothetical protein [Massilimicrobiota timonensis]|nr:hypothetical protein [Massilimicrobiota timonensis]
MSGIAFFNDYSFKMYSFLMVMKKFFDRIDMNTNMALKEYI